MKTEYTSSQIRQAAYESVQAANLFSRLSTEEQALRVAKHYLSLAKYASDVYELLCLPGLGEPGRSVAAYFMDDVRRQQLGVVGYAFFPPENSPVSTVERVHDFSAFKGDPECEN
jgi:hypothetical protein